MKGIRCFARFFVVLLCCAACAIATASPPVEVYGRLPKVELMRLSPTGQRYAFIAVAGEDRKLIVADFEGKVLLGGPVGTAKVRNIRWADEDHLTVTVSATIDSPFNPFQALEMMSVVAVDLKAGKSSAIFGNTTRIAHAVFGEYGFARSEVSLYGYYGGITLDRSITGQGLLDHGYADLYRVDLATLEAEQIAHGGNDSRRWIVARDGSIVAHSEYEQKSGNWRLFEGKSHDKLLLEQLAPLSDISLVGSGRAPGTVLIGHEVAGTHILEEVSIADGKRERLFASVAVTELLRDPDSGLLIGAQVLGPKGGEFFDPKAQARFDGTRKAFPNLQVRIESITHDLDRIIVHTDGGQDSGTFYLVDLATHEATAVGQSYPHVAAADVGVTTRVGYVAADGLKIEGILTLPPGRKPEKLPLVVMPHGGPIGVRDDLKFDWWAQAFASAGYAVLQPNYRGSSGRGEAFVQAGFGEWGRKMQTDLSDGVARLASRGVIDPARVCIVGASYGGYAALAGVTLQHGIYRCAVSVAGPSDLAAFFDWQIDRHGYSSSATRYWRAVTGAEKGGREAMKEISPSHFARQADAPILLIHGKDDTVVPIAQSREMADELKDAGKPVELVVMDGEDHWLSREKTRTTMLKAAVSFVQKHNPAE